MLVIVIFLHDARDRIFGLEIARARRLAWRLAWRPGGRASAANLGFTPLHLAPCPPVSDGDSPSENEANSIGILGPGRAVLLGYNLYRVCVQIVLFWIYRTVASISRPRLITAPKTLDLSY